MQANNATSGAVLGEVVVSVTNSDDNGDSQFKDVGPAPATGVLTYRFDDRFPGDWCIEITQADGTQAFTGFTFDDGAAGSASFVGRIYGLLASYPPSVATAFPIQVRSTTDTRIVTINMETTGTLSLRNSAGGLLGSVGTVPVPTNTLVRYELTGSGLNGGTNSATVSLSWYLGDSTTPEETLTATSVTLAGLARYWRVGRMGASTGGFGTSRFGGDVFILGTTTPPALPVYASAAVASGSGAGVAAVQQVGANAGLAAATGDLPFDPTGSTISLVMTGQNPVVAFGVAFDPTIRTTGVVSLGRLAGTFTIRPLGIVPVISLGCVTGNFSVTPLSVAQSPLRIYQGPTRVESWPLAPGARIAVKVVVNQTLYRVDGVWHIGENLTYSDTANADRVYYGGYDLALSSAQLDELVAAGLGQYVITVSGSPEPEPDPVGLGVAPLGVSPLGL